MEKKITKIKEVRGEAGSEEGNAQGVRWSR